MMPVSAEPDALTASARWDVKQLLRGDAFPHAVQGFALRETHLSWVILTGSFAYKVKKALKLDFIDATTLQQRQHYCEEEFRLNKRLAGDLYIGVVPISLQDGQPRVGISSGPIVDYAVCMRQFDGAAELANLLKHDDVALSEMTDLAQQLALFHMCAPVAARTTGGEATEQMYDTVFANLDALIADAHDFDPSPALARLADWTQEQARALEPIFNLRARSGCIRECHGDLHSRNIVRWKNHLVPFDCIEFDPQLRWIDVLSDLAFLVMDLVSHERDDLAAGLLSKYLETTGDYDGVRVLPFYAVHRALVRAKVDSIMARQSSVHAAEFRQRLQRRVQTAIEWLDRPRPMLILMHGPSGSGKSWLSERLVPNLPAVRIRSDVERKRFAAGPIQNDGLYSAHVNHRTYARLLECTESVLQAGFNVIVDAACLDPVDRELFRGLAARLQCPYTIVSCRADAATLAHRIQERAHAGTDPSDADQRVLDAQLDSLQPFDAQEQPHVIVADTRQSLVMRQVTAALQARVAESLRR